jgi:fibronectin-binding autotransporter adhesin
MTCELPCPNPGQILMRQRTASTNKPVKKMKPKSIMKLSKSLLILTTTSVVGALGSAHAASWYWDADDSTAGFGTAGGTWAAPTDAGAIGWSDDSTGASAIGSVTTTTSDTLYFGTDSLGLASGTVAVSGTVDAGNITFGSQSGDVTLSGGTINLGTSVITTNNASNTISSILAGTGATLTKSGTGTLILGQSNSYTGGTVVNSGTLTLANADATLNVGSIRGALTINQGAQVNANANGWSFGAGAGALGTATAVTSIAINGGLLNFSNAGNGDGGYIGSSIVLNGGTIGGTSFGWYHANVDFTKTLQTVASSTRSTVSGGISLRLSASGSLTFDVASGSTVDGIDLLVSGPITNAANGGGGNIVKTGSGRMVMTGTNTFNGGVTVANGVLQLGDGSNTNAVLPTNKAIALDAGTKLLFNLGNFQTPNYALVFNGDATLGNMSNNELGMWTASSLNGNGRTLTIDSSGSGPLTFLNSRTSSLGQINIVRGTVRQDMSQGKPLQDASMDISSQGGFATWNAGTINNNITLNGGNGVTGASAQHQGALSHEGYGVATYTGTITLASGTSTLNSYNFGVGGGMIMSGLITGAGSMTKTGPSTLTLSHNNNDYTGTTTVNAGTLLVNGEITNSSVTVNSGILGGTGSISASTTIAAEAFVAPGTAGIGTLELASASLAGTYSCEVDDSFADLLDVSGTLTVVSGATVAFTTLGTPTQAEYLIASYATGDVSLLAFTNVPAGYEVDTETSGVIKLVKISGGGYSSWADSWSSPALSDKTPGGDPDNDGISNLLEYVLGGDPRISDTDILPSQKIEGGFLVLSYTRSDDSEADTQQTGQWSTDLANWTDIAPVLISENNADPDDMEIRIPLSNAVNGKLFGRLKVSNGN